MVVPLAMESGEICTGQVILQPIPLKSDRLLGELQKSLKFVVPARVAVAAIRRVNRVGFVAARLAKQLLQFTARYQSSDIIGAADQHSFDKHHRKSWPAGPHL